MKIIKVAWKNFGAYGNKGGNLDLSKTTSSFNLLVGKNGSGKSTVMEVIQFALYGKVNGKKMKDLPNRINLSKKLETYIELISNNHHITIHRGISPSFLEVTIDGNTDVADIAGKLNVQDYLEDEIFQIPFYVFNNIISLSINDFKSFIKMSPRDKRTIIDKIFGLSIINEMLSCLKDDVKKVKDEFTLIKSKIGVLSEQIKRGVDEYNILSEKLKVNISDKKDDIAEKLKKLKKLKDKLNEDLDHLEEERDASRNTLSNIKSILYKKNAVKETLSEKLELYKNDKCPTCSSDLHTTYHKELTKDYQTAFDKNENDITKLKKEIETVTEYKNKHDNLISEINQKISKIQANNSILVKEYKALYSDENLDEQTLSIKTLIQENKDKLTNAKTVQDKTNNKLNFYTIIEDVLGENGVKKLAIKTILPTINNQIQQLIKELNLDFILTFDESFNSKILHLGKDVSSATLSSGENKKLDFAVIIAIIKLMKNKFPGLNILFLDEIFASLDADSSYHILKILSEISKDNNVHIFVVNHAIMDNSPFDNNYLITKTNGFSSIAKQILD